MPDTFRARAGTASELPELLLELDPEPLLEPELLLELEPELLPELPLLPEPELDPELAELPFEPPAGTALEARSVFAPPHPARKTGTDKRVKFTTAKRKTFFLKILMVLPGLAVLPPWQTGID